MSRFHFNIPLGQSDGCPCGFKRNDIFGAIGSIGSAVVSGIFSGSQQGSAMEFSDEQARLAYERQRALNEQGYDIAKRLQDAQNVYNTPEAQVARYRKAGLNPFLMAHGNNIGSGMSQGSQPAPSGSAPMAQTPHANSIQVPDFGSILLQASAIKNDAVKAKSEFIKSMPDLIKSVGSKKAKEIASNIFGRDLDTSYVTREIDSYLIRQESEAKIESIKADLEEQFGFDNAQKLNAQLGNMVTKLYHEVQNLKASVNVSNMTAKEIQKRINTYASQIAKNWAEVAHLKASAEQIQKLTPYLVDSAYYAAQMDSMDYWEQNADFIQGTRARAWQISPEGQQEASLMQIEEDNPEMSLFREVRSGNRTSRRKGKRYR